ncbi:MAG: DUF4956 domain-containing protein [Verrucomicrobia bacterium]|nr:DUF4956 domain-containing protein [Verrucomicrobiota bacterium]MCH8513390.1 DUF4956 domain-containing protein [Kiritimatiellia bacterium]
MIEQLLFSDAVLAPVDWTRVLLSVLLAFVSGQTLAWTYMFTHTGLSYSRSYVTSLVMIPMLVSLVMMVLANNLTTAFGLMSLFAIVRFRNVLRDTMDTCFILAGITVGMASGTGRYGTAVLGLSAICLVLLYLSFAQFGVRHRFDAILNLHWDGSPADTLEIDHLLRRHSRRAVRVGLESTESHGTDLSFRLLLRDPARLGELQEEAQTLQHASRVSVMSTMDESEI